VSASTLLVTMGDAAGIGPEIIVRAAQQGALQGCTVVADVGVMRRAQALLGDATSIDVWQPPGLPSGLSEQPWGQVRAACGRAAAVCIEAAVQRIQQGSADAMVTAPLHKEALAAAGLPYPGHTEMLQALAGGAPVRMMLANPELKVVLVTIHLALRRAIEAVTFDAVLQTLRITHKSLSAQRIAVAGLNPHAGEGGLFGDEERTIIAPAIEAAVAEGIPASGPYAPDTIFMRARKGEFDVVVAMTHDHGLIPVKYLGVEQGVNVTLGLPFVRTSPDHGTAFDIAGQGVADASSLVAALRWARQALQSLSP
jgi:4-hydroxythreonine-4-phosphate dehydrogenase